MIARELKKCPVCKEDHMDRNPICNRCSLIISTVAKTIAEAKAQTVTTEPPVEPRTEHVTVEEEGQRVLDVDDSITIPQPQATPSGLQQPEVKHQGKAIQCTQCGVWKFRCKYHIGPKPERAQGEAPIIILWFECAKDQPPDRSMHFYDRGNVCITCRNENKRKDLEKHAQRQQKAEAQAAAEARTVPTHVSKLQAAILAEIDNITKKVLDICAVRSSNLVELEGTLKSMETCDIKEFRSAMAATFRRLITYLDTRQTELEFAVQKAWRLHFLEETKYHEYKQSQIWNRMKSIKRRLPKATAGEVEEEEEDVEPEPEGEEEGEIW